MTFPAGAGHTPHHKHSVRESKALSLQAPALGTGGLVREGDQPHTKVGTVCGLGSWKG